MTEDDMPAIVAGAEVLHFPKPKTRKPRAKRARPANDDVDRSELDDGGFSVEDMNEEWGLVLLGSKSVMLREVPTAPVEDRLRFLAVDAFKTFHLNSTVERRQRDGKVKSVTHADAWLRSRERRTYDGVEFCPDPNPDAIAGTPGYFNLWQGFGVQPEKRAGAKYDVFTDHLRMNVCKGDQALHDWIFGWFAHMVQKPRERTGTAIVLRGKRGTGKTKIGEVMGSLLPSHYFLVDDPRYLVGQFNAHLASCLLLQADEGFWAGDKAAEGRLKGLITAEYQMIESKGVDPIRLRNYVRLLITSNENWVIPAGKDERRFLVCDVGDHVAQNHDYFAEMDAELDAGGRAALLHDLLAFDLSRVNLRVAPHTDALLEQKLQTLDNFDAWWFERLDSGETRRAAGQWQRTLSVDSLYEDYEKFVERFAIGKLILKPLWGKRLQEAMQGQVKGSRPRGLEGRFNAYELPSLEEARSAFEFHVKQRVAWSDINFDTSERDGDAIF